jgi:hypothetical protein
MRAHLSNLREADVKLEHRIYLIDEQGTMFPGWDHYHAFQSRHPIGTFPFVGRVAIEVFE